MIGEGEHVCNIGAYLTGAWITRHLLSAGTMGMGEDLSEYGVSSKYSLSYNCIIMSI